MEPIEDIRYYKNYQIDELTNRTSRLEKNVYKPINKIGLLRLGVLGGLSGLSAYGLLNYSGLTKKQLAVLTAINLGALNAYVLNSSSYEPISDLLGFGKRRRKRSKKKKNRRSKRKN